MNHRRYTLLPLILALLPSASAQVSSAQVSAQIEQANNSVITYLPDLQNATLAKTLKMAAGRNIPVTILTTRKSHMLPGSYLLSVALANAQTPPRPLRYSWVKLNSPPIVIVDRVNVYYGQGLVDGYGSIQKATASFAQKSLQTLSNLAQQSAPVKAHKLVEERFNILPLPERTTP